jgi:hypothetical protein
MGTGSTIAGWRAQSAVPGLSCFATAKPCVSRVEASNPGSIQPSTQTLCTD